MTNTPHNPAAPAPPTKVVSTLTGDPDMTELIEMFVDEIPERMRLVSEHWERRNFDDLRRIAHQLKGACGGYGFPTVGIAAGTLEACLADKPSRPDHTDLESIANQVNELLDLCRRVRAA
ncbi:MAG TPA: Hpt domain-containing protein [Phycisphaerales bacterium]|nr:Hpt domain-containing protein [Phycisphaerales bacterium]